MTGWQPMRKKKPSMSHDSPVGLIEPGLPTDESIEALDQGRSDLEEPTLSLPASLTIADVAEVQAALLESLGSGREWRLDASEIEVIDGAGMQLLAAVSNAAAQRQAKIVWSGMSAVVTAAAGRLGLVKTLQLDGNSGNARTR